MQSPNFHVEVECSTDARGENVPSRFSFHTREIIVEELLDIWPAEDYRYFKLRGDDKGIYLLRHNIIHDEWELILFDSGKRDETRLSST